MKRPPKTPRSTSRIITGTRNFDRINSKTRRKDIKNPEIHDRPSCICSFNNLPETRDPIAIPTAVVKNKYPPPTSVRLSDCMAKGMVLSWAKPPIKRKKPDPITEESRCFRL